jgi:hypothetical protein
MRLLKDVLRTFYISEASFYPNLKDVFTKSETGGRTIAHPIVDQAIEYLK